MKKHLPDYGDFVYSFAAEGIKKVLNDLNALWTDEGWIVEGSHSFVNLSNYYLKRLPKFARIEGSFSCKDNVLKDLKGLPCVIKGDFDCSNNLLETIKDGPVEVAHCYNCSNNNLSDKDELSRLKVGVQLFSEHNFIEYKPAICLDFDGVLHDNRGKWEGPHVAVGDLVYGSLEFIKEALDKGYRVCIFSARNNSIEGIVAMRDFLIAKGLSPGLTARIKFPSIKPPALLYLDDRGYHFNGRFPSFDFIKTFKPWNKK